MIEDFRDKYLLRIDRFGLRNITLTRSIRGLISRLIVLVSICFFLFNGSGFIIARTDEVVSEDDAMVKLHEVIQYKIDEIAKKYHAVGVSVSVVQNGEVVDSYSYGWAVKNVNPMTENSKIRVASISKVILGMEAMKLQEKGAVNIDASIGDYWGFPIYNRRYPNKTISLHKILTHTSSIRPEEISAGSSASIIPLLKKGSVFNNTLPGEISSWCYNNYAFGILGMTLERATGKCVNDMLVEDYFSAMDIDAAYGGKRIVDKANIAAIYSDGRVYRSIASISNYGASETPGISGSFFAGGLVISSKDLAKMVAILSNDGVYRGLPLLSPASVEQIENVIDVPTSAGFYQGLVLRLRHNMHGRNRIYYHTGSSYGVHNEISYDPDLKDGIVVLTSGASGTKDSNGVYAVCGEITDLLYKFY